MIFDGDRTVESKTSNVNFPNIYTVKKIGVTNRVANGDSLTSRQEIVLDYSLNTQYLNSGASTLAHVYKFYPPQGSNADGGYRFAAPCAGRGVCNTDNGLCECFAGFSDDNCNCINALAV